MSILFIILIALFVVNLALISWAITDLMPRQKVRYLSKTGWIIIIALVFFGSVLYLFLGRGDNEDLKSA